ncbi:hypothetical protein G0U57_016388, partial [Chelydra serpentina]
TRYTDLDPEDINGKRVLIPLFIGQSYEDIRKKLQKLEGALGKNIEELLEIAMKVYDRRDDEERKKGARVLAMALREGYEERGDKVKGGQGHRGREGALAWVEISALSVRRRDTGRMNAPGDRPWERNVKIEPHPFPSSTT